MPPTKTVSNKRVRFIFSGDRDRPLLPPGSKVLPIVPSSAERGKQVWRWDCLLV